MKKIGVFICNYNKAKQVVKCVGHVLGQTFGDIDIFVVDNASEDNSVVLLEETYGNRISIIKSETNTGGSGGFGRAIRTAVEMDYPYFMLIDNDAFLEYDAIKILFDYMEEHDDVGICGTQILYESDREKIQDLGGKIDFEKYMWGGMFGGQNKVNGNVIVECDYVASCALIARTSAVRVFGGFPEKNFIYYDDIEWCTKCRIAGYKVVANGNACVYHDMSGAKPSNLFLAYYSNRNRCRYFTKYLPKGELESFYNIITEELFSRIYGAEHKGMHGTAQTLLNAFDDFANGIRGKAYEGKILPYDKPKEPALDIIGNAKKITIFAKDKSNQNQAALQELVRYFLRINSELEIRMTYNYVSDDSDYVFVPCDHVYRISENILPYIYFDIRKNFVLSEADYEYYSSFQKELNAFRDKYRRLFDKRIMEERA